MTANGNDLTTPLDGLCYTSAIEGNAVNVAAYLKRGANITALSQSTLLGAVAKRGYVEVLRVLLDAGADPNYSSKETEITALMQAARAGHAETVRFLLERGATVGDTPEQRYQTLSWSVVCDDAEIIQLLLSHGIAVDVRSATGATALMRAASCGSVDAIQALLTAGANVNAVSSNRMTALRCARRFGQAKAEAALKEAGAKEIPLSSMERLRDRLFSSLLHSVSKQKI